jgi:hypothetical protein
LKVISRDDFVLLQLDHDFVPVFFVDFARGSVLYSADFNSLREDLMDRWIICGVSALVLVLVLGSFVAARSGADASTFPVSFVITSAGCPNLPDGTTITGAGTETSITTTVSHHGEDTLVNSTHAHGTATDQDGNTYVFEYANSSRGVLSEEGILTGQMNDHFSLAGSGPAHLVNGFNADFVLDFSTFAFSADPKHSFGDPIDFTTGAAHCDPL